MKIKYEDHTKHYDIGKQLGKGGFGEVREVTHKKTGKKRAAKYINTKDADKEEIASILREIELLS